MFENQIQGIPTPTLFQFVERELGLQQIKTSFGNEGISVDLQTVVIPTTQQVSENPANFTYEGMTLNLRNVVIEETVQEDANFGYSGMSVDLTTVVIEESVQQESTFSYSGITAELQTVVVQESVTIADDTPSLEYTGMSVNLQTV